MPHFRAMWAKWFVAAVPVVLVAGCGSSSKGATSAAPAPASVRTVTVTPSAAPVLDTQGKIFCTLVDKARAETPTPDVIGSTGNLDGKDLVAQVEDQHSATVAAEKSGNAAVKTFITNIGAIVGDADLQKARDTCESQGWVGTP